MASLTRAGFEPGLLARTTLRYGEEHFPVELTIDTRGEDAGFIDFAHDGGGRYRSARQAPANRFHLIRQIDTKTQ